MAPLPISCRKEMTFCKMVICGRSPCQLRWTETLHLSGGAAAVQAGAVLRAVGLQSPEEYRIAASGPDRGAPAGRMQARLPPCPMPASPDGSNKTGSKKTEGQLRTFWRSPTSRRRAHVVGPAGTPSRRPPPAWSCSAQKLTCVQPAGLFPFPLVRRMGSAKLRWLMERPENNGGCERHRPAHTHAASLASLWQYSDASAK